jgi:hypothetical protein
MGWRNEDKNGQDNRNCGPYGETAIIKEAI